MNRIDVLMNALHKAIPTNGNTEYSVSKWRKVAEVIDEELLSFEETSDTDVESQIRMVLSANDGANPRAMSEEIMKELSRHGSLTEG